MVNSPVITGIGVVSPIGTGKDLFWNALLEKASGVDEISKFNAEQYPYRRAAEIDNFSLEAYTDDRRFRRAADASRFAIGATSLALNDAGIKALDGKRTSLSLGVTHGAMNMTRQFHEGLVSGEGASPMLFSDSVLNAPAGNVSICFGIKGGYHALIGGAPVGITAVGLASNLLMSGKVDVAIVCGTEEIDEIIYLGYSKFGYFPAEDGFENELSPFDIRKKGFVMGEGAGAFILERQEDAMKRGARIYAEVSGWSSSCSPDVDDEALKRIMLDILKKRETNPDEIGFVYSGALGSAFDYQEASAIKTLFKKHHSPLMGSLSPNVGEAFVTTTIFQVISASLIIEKGVIPPNVKLSTVHPEWRNLPIPKEAMETPIRVAMINAIGLEGSRAALMLKKL